MTEDKFEDFIRKAAPSYNVPPVRTPRDEMWAAIQAQRSAGPRVVYGGSPSVRAPGRVDLGRRVWLGAAAAAVLLVATGVGIGRWTASPTLSPGSLVTPNLPANPVVVKPSSSEAVSAGPQQRTGSSEAPPASADRERTLALGTSRSTETNLGETRKPGNAAAAPDATNAAYRLAATQHLTDAEALLTSFRARSAADQQMDAQLGAWARQLLNNTRLLLDSPAANDPTRRPLLEDLELVLVQIVQLSPGSTPEDRDLVEKTLQHDHVMTRLRTAIPAGAQRGS
ncbi:MAG TPA: hypothetical protein VE110_07755 [Gemmatimonadaceae bacterium]|nr:hypothetical protein [Gemmatimonadaceae bacterium]